jgi:hypothetical protein
VLEGRPPDHRNLLSTTPAEVLGPDPVAEANAERALATAEENPGRALSPSGGKEAKLRMLAMLEPARLSDEAVANQLGVSINTLRNYYVELRRRRREKLAYTDPQQMVADLLMPLGNIMAGVQRDLINLPSNATNAEKTALRRLVLETQQRMVSTLLNSKYFDFAPLIVQSDIEESAGTDMAKIDRLLAIAVRDDVESEEDFKEKLGELETSTLEEREKGLF